MDNNADNAFPDLLSAALSESGLTDDLEDFSQYYSAVEEVPAPQPSVQFQPLSVRQPVEQAQHVYQTSPGPHYIQQPQQQSTPVAVQRHPVVRPNIIPANRAVVQSPQQNLVRLTSAGTPVNIGGRTVRLVSANSGAGTPSNVRKIIIKTVPAGSANPRQGQTVTNVNTSNVARVLQATTAGAQPRIIQNTLSNARIIQTVPATQTGQPIRFRSPSQGNLVPSIAGQSVTGPTRLALNRPGIKVIRLATSKGASPQGNVFTLPSNIRPGVPVRIVPVRAGPGGLTTGPSQIVTSLSSMGTGPSSIVATAKQQGSNVRVVSIQKPQISQGISQPPPVIAQAPGAVPSAGLRPAVTSTQNTVRVTLSQPPGAANPVFPPGSILTLPSKTLPTTSVIATAPQTIPSVTRYTVPVSDTTVRTVRVIPKLPGHPTASVSSPGSNLVTSILPTSRSTRPIPVAKKDTFQQSFIEHFQSQQSIEASPVQRAQVKTEPSIKTEIDQDMSDYEIGSGDSSRPLTSIPAIVKMEFPEAKPDIKSVPNLEAVKIDVEKEPVKADPLNIKTEPNEEPNGVISQVSVSQESDIKPEVKSEPAEGLKIETLSQEKDLISHVKPEVDVVKEESLPGDTVTETTVTETTVTETALKEEDNIGSMGFGLFGGDDASDPFFQALQQLQETNIKAAEFEKQTKIHQVETTQAPSSEAKPASPLTVTSSQGQATTPRVASYSQSLLEQVSSSGKGRTSPMFSLGEPFMERSQSPISILQQRSGSPLLVQRIGSPVPQGYILPRVGSPSLLTQVPRVGSPSLLTQGKLSLNGSQASLQSLGFQTQKKVTVTKILPGGIIQTSQVTLPVSTTAPSSVLPAGTTFTVGPQGIIKTTSASNQLGSRMVIGSSPGLGNVTQAGKFSTVTSGYNGAVNMIKKELSEKDVSRLWSNEDLKLKRVKEMAQPTYASPRSPVPMLSQPRMLAEEEADDEEEELGQAETYAEYMPAKLKIGQKHPDPVVETSSLSSVEPQDVHYKVVIPETTIDYGSLSALQLEAVVYSCQKHETYLPAGERAGFLIGDGAGVGKGRTIAGIIYENYLQGRKRALWLSVSNDLRVDAERDLRDIGASKIDVHPLNKFKYAKISSKINGSVKKGVIFATYSSLIGESHSGGKYKTRLKQLTHWLDRDFDGVIVFDECHRAKNLCPVGSSKPTKTGMTVLELQNRLPKARIVYASATGASEPRHMAYMTRLGMWGKGTPFKEFNDFIQAVEKRGVGAMELVAMDMKLRGMYIARQLSFKGVSFKVDEIPIAKDFIQVYNESVHLWVEAREKFQRAAELIDAEQRMKKTMWGQFWSAHQRFFKYLCISAKVRHCVRLAREAVKNGKCVVIGLQSTGEARTLEQLEESGGELNDFVSTAKGVIQTLVEKHFPAPDRSKTAGLFGMGSSIFDSPMPSPKYNTGNKRKKDQSNTNMSKKARNDFSDDSDNDSDDSADSDKSAKISSSESEISLSESEDSEQDSADDNFNPFGNGSDSDEDPWLKKAKKSKPSKKEKKKKEKQKEKMKKKKEKKEKKEKKKRNKKKKSKKDSDDSDDEFDDIDKKFDEALAAAGLKGEGVDSPFSREATPFSSMIKSTAELGKDAIEQAINMKRELLEKIERLGDKFPPNTLDELIDALGGPESVAEMTGRKGRVVSTDEGVQYESRSEADTPLELLNLTEKQRFMDGEKYVAIISEAASSGISLQADRRALNQRRRVHITLELPWSADRAIQQFGRTHRSNQVSAPEYMFLISELAGERRFASTVAKRLESLGALTHGDRRATECRDLSRFNIDNKYGRTALEAVMKSVLQFEAPLVLPPDTYQGNFFADVKVALIGVGMINCDDRNGFPTLDKDYNNISKFLNRILGTTVELQNNLFKYFTNTLAAIILQAKRNGRWDMGILDLGTTGDTVKVLEARNFHGSFSGTQTRVTVSTISVERGMTWLDAMEMWRQHDGSEDGFYVSTQTRNSKCPAILAVAMSGKRMGKERVYSIYRPSTGRQGRAEPLSEIKQKYRKVYPDDARYHWEDQFDSSTTICSHAFWKGSCKRVTLGLSCETGLRSRTYFVLSGSVLSVWNRVESVLASVPGGHISRMQIIRLRTDDGKRIVGTLVPANAVLAMKAMLSQDTSDTPSPFHPTLPSLGAPALHHSASMPIMHQKLTLPMVRPVGRQGMTAPMVQPVLRQTMTAPMVRPVVRQRMTTAMVQPLNRVTSTPAVQPVAPNPPSQFVVNPRLLGFNPPKAQTDSVTVADTTAAPPTNEKQAPQQYLSMPMFL